MPWLPDLHTPEEDLAFFRDRVFQECTIKIATADRLVGFCAFRKDWLDHLYLDPDWKAAASAQFF